MIAFSSFTIFLIYMNVPAVLVNEYGFPRAVALLILMLLAVPVAYRVLIRGEGLRFPGLIIAAILMLACHTISALVSTRPHEALESVFSWLLEGVMLAFLVVNALRSRDEVLAAARAIVVAGAVMGFLVMLQQMLGPNNHDMAGFGQYNSEDPDRVQYRLSGPIGEVNRFAQILAVLLPLAAGLAVSAPTKQRWLYWIAAALICGGLALTFSRGAMVALVLVMPFALFFGLVRLRYLAVVVIIGTVLIAANPHLAKRVSSIGEVALQSLGLEPGGFRNADGASRGRVTEMQAAGLLFLDHPLLGAGPGMAPKHYADYAVLVGGKVRQGTRRTHNLYLQLAAETGVVGLFAFIIVIWIAVYAIDETRNRAKFTDKELWGLACGLEIGILILLATSLFLHAAYVRYFWLLLALAIAASSLPVRPIPAQFLTPAMRNVLGRLEGQL